MGYDISNHAVDTALFTERLVPAVLGQNISIDDLLDRATDVAVVASRANQWGLKVLQLKHDFSTEQMRAEVEKFIGLDFNADLYIWGRPFFITGDTVDESLDAFARYLACTRHDLSAVDRIAEEMVTRLDSKKPPLPPNPTRWELKLDRMYPLAAHLPQLKKAEDRKDADPAATRQRLAALFDVCKQAWSKRDSKTKIMSIALEEPVRANELAPTVPYMLLNLASQALPGWMGRGLAWPTQLFEKIGVSVAHIFESPLALFEPLVRALPAIEESFGTTIRQNYSLGGYVRPEKVPALRQLLEKHERELVYAWCSPVDIEKGNYAVLSTDYRKIIEPVALAERNRYGFIEAAEVYSGIMGVMN